MDGDGVEAEPTADTLVGRTLAGKFVIEALVRAGAMGAIYRAHHIALDKTVCVKVMHPELATDPRFIRRFHREAKAASRLEHPSSLHILDFGREAEDGLLFIAMEFLDGKDLYEVIHEEGPLAPQRIIHILSQVLSVLAIAHDVKILHRDLKPENIMLVPTNGDDGRVEELVKVCDFGIAKMSDATSTSDDDLDVEPNDGVSRLSRGLIIGTPEYMSPEQARGGALDARSDLYSVGVLLYHMLTGRPPFEGETNIEIVLKQMHEEPPTPSSIYRHTHPDLERICLRAMKKDPDDRFASAREMRAELRKILGIDRISSITPVPSQPIAMTSTTATSSSSSYEDEIAIDVDLDFDLDEDVEREETDEVDEVDEAHEAESEESEVRPQMVSLIDSMQHDSRRRSRRFVVGFLSAAAILTIAGGFAIRSKTADAAMTRMHLQTQTQTQTQTQMPAPTQIQATRTTLPAPVALAVLAVEPTATATPTATPTSALPTAVTPSRPAPITVSPRAIRAVNAPPAPVTMAEATAPAVVNEAAPAALPPPQAEPEKAADPALGQVAPASIATHSSAAAPPPATAIEPIHPEKARVEIGAPTKINGATANGFQRALLTSSSKLDACLRATPSIFRTSLDGASSTLHLETDDVGVITHAQLSGGSIQKDLGACVSRAAVGGRVANVDTGSASADIPLTYRYR